MTVGAAFGIDGLAAAAVRAGGRDTPPHLLHARYLPFSGGGIADRLAEWVDEHDLNKCRGVGVIAGADYQVMQVETPPVPATEMRQAAAWRVRDLVDFPLDQAVIDTFPPPTTAQRGQDNVNVVVAKRAAVTERIDQLKAAGLSLEAIDIPELVQRNISLRLPEARGGHGLLALDEREGLITVFREGEQFLARALDTGRRDLQDAPEDAGENLLLEVQRSFDYFDSALSQPPLGALYVHPAGRAESALLELFGDNLSNIELRAFGLGDVATLDVDPPHEGALMLHALGAGLRSEGKPA